MITNIYTERVMNLQSQMRMNNIDFYYMRDADPHGSEYVSDYFKIRTFFSGFTGSNGNLLISQEKAYLWTDGRYFIQAEEELKGSNITLMKMQVKSVKSPEEIIKESEKKVIVIALNGENIQQAFCESLKKKIEAKDITVQIQSECRLAEEIFMQKRFDLQCKPIEILSLQLTGEPCMHKVNTIRQNLKKQGADILFINCLDEIMWVFNIRGRDIPCNPIAYSFAVISNEIVKLYVREDALNEELKNYALSEGFDLGYYDDFFTEMKKLSMMGKTLLSNESVTVKMAEIIMSAENYVKGNSGIAELKAKKNITEITNLKRVYRLDSAAVCKFMYWLSKVIKTEEISEVCAALKIDEIRKNLGSREPSFDTISAYGKNAASMHYEAKPGNESMLKTRGMYLFDSGGQYLGGTTDVTRTVALGECSQEMRDHFTDVVKGVLALQNVTFHKGCSGNSLDILARQFLWNNGEDYRCGTGHGIGYMLSVHEGPQSIRSSRNPNGEVDLAPGMLVSNEPGYYKDGEYGIRIENILLCKEKEETDYGQFYDFDVLTLVPIDTSLLNLNRMTGLEIAQLNRYHERVQDEISTYLTDDESDWLKQACLPITAKVE